MVSKADLGDPVDLAGTGWPEGTLWTSAVTGEGIAELAAAIVRRLVPEEAEEPGLLAGAVPFTARQVAWVEEARQRVRDELHPVSSIDTTPSSRHGGTKH